MARIHDFGVMQDIPITLSPMRAWVLLAAISTSLCARGFSVCPVLFDFVKVPFGAFAQLRELLLQRVQLLRRSDPIDLDSRYLEMIANDYPDLIRRFQTVTDSAADADLRAVAAPAGQTLQGHLRRAQTIARMLHMPLPAGARQ